MAIIAIELNCLQYLLHLISIRDLSQVASELYDAV